MSSARESEDSQWGNTEPRPSAGGGADESGANVRHDVEEPATVLQVFGVEIKVRNPRLAEVLTRDLADSAPRSSPERTREVVHEVAEALPDVIVHTVTPRDEDQARHRIEVRARVETAGRGLGFEVRPSGVWVSPARSVIVTRVVDRTITPAAAADFLAKLDEALASGGARGASVLIVVDPAEAVETFATAVRQRRAHDHARVISLDDLEFLLLKHSQSAIDHEGVLALLTPIADIDVAALLDVVRSAVREACE